MSINYKFKFLSVKIWGELTFGHPKYPCDILGSEEVDYNL